MRADIKIEDGVTFVRMPYPLAGEGVEAWVNIELVREMARPVVPKFEHAVPPPMGYSFAPGARRPEPWSPITGEFLPPDVPLSASWVVI
jgi:hypothetical protein